MPANKPGAAMCTPKLAIRGRSTLSAVGVECVLPTGIERISYNRLSSESWRHDLVSRDP